MQGIAHEITERKRRESELALERSLLQALLDNVPDYVYFKDKECRFIRTSKAHARTFGLDDPKKAIGKTDMDFFSEEHAGKAYEDEKRILRTGEPLLNAEEKETRPGRPDTWALTTKMPLRDQHGNIVGTFGISRDITEGKRAEKALRESEERYRQLVELSPDSILVHREGKVAFVNSSAATLFGAERPEALLGKDVMDLVHPEFREIVQQRSRTVQQGGEPVPREEQKCLRLDGTAFDIEVSSAPIIYDGVRASLTIVRDITERKQLEENLEREKTLLLTLIDNLPDHVSVKDTESRFLITNTSNARVLGLKRAQDAVGKTDLDFYPSSEAARYLADERTVIQTGTALINSEEESVDLDGRKR